METHLCLPPPSSSVHVMIEALCVVGIRIVPLREEHQVRCEFRITPEGLDAEHYVAVEKVVRLVANENLVRNEGRAHRGQRIHDGVELAHVLVRQLEAFLNLSKSRKS